MTDHSAILIDGTPALEVCRWALRQPDLPAEIASAAAAALAQSPEWTDRAMASETRTGFWSTPASKYGDNFNRRKDLDADVSIVSMWGHVLLGGFVVAAVVFAFGQVV